MSTAQTTLQQARKPRGRRCFSHFCRYFMGEFIPSNSQPTNTLNHSRSHNHSHSHRHTPSHPNARPTHAHTHTYVHTHTPAATPPCHEYTTSVATHFRFRCLPSSMDSPSSSRSSSSQGSAAKRKADLDLFVCTAPGCGCKTTPGPASLLANLAMKAAHDRPP